MQKWIITGVSGCGRIELLEELSKYAKRNINKRVRVYDVGKIMKQECERIGIGFSEQYILDRDQSLLKSIRSTALKEIQRQIERKQVVDIHLIGVHALFRWKHYLVPGLSYADLRGIKPDGFINVVDDVDKILNANKMNPKWESEAVPDSVEAQEWMNEEIFITELLAEVSRKKSYVIARQHETANLLDLFFSNKKKIYLSYPITPIRQSHPDLLQMIQGDYLKELEKLFVVFNPLAIKDMSLNLTDEANQLIKVRTVERDYKFIDQSDAVVVLYMTDKMSPGVMSEISYAHRNQKPIYMLMESSDVSPFLEYQVEVLTNEWTDLLRKLETFTHGERNTFCT